MSRRQSGKDKTAPNPVEAMVGPRVNRDVDGILR